MAQDDRFAQNRRKNGQRRLQVARFPARHCRLLVAISMPLVNE
jgi:hypothetical protein